MKLPRPSAEATRLFRDLLPAAPGVVARKMFGQPAAFVHGHLFFGVFGGNVFVRLSEGDRTKVERIPGVVPFEPMPGRPMREYRVLPRSLLARPAEARQWVGRSLEFARGLPPKTGRD